MLAAFFLAACRSDTSSAPALSPTTAVPSVTATPKFAEVTGVSFAELLNARQGWVIAGGGLFWTEDAGQDWRQMTPNLSRETRIGNAFTLDPSHAWVLLCEVQDSDSVIKVAYTTDGGTDWANSEVASVLQLTSHPDDQWCGRTDLGQLFFLDSQQGWVMVDHTETMNSHIGEFFQTLDGGKTWKHLGFSPSGEFRFTSPTIGWMRASCCGGGPWQLYRTQDGGETWKAVVVSGSGDDDDFFLPVFFGQHEGILVAILRDQGVARDGITFFRSSDGGTTWKPTGKLAVVYDGLNIGGVNDVEVATQEAWAVALPGKGVYWTTDGGQHWIENQTARSIQRLSLGSPTSGWGLECVEGAAPACVRLVVTQDQGQHWQPLVIKP